MSIAEIVLVLFVVLVFLGTWWLYSITRPQAQARGSTMTESNAESVLDEDSIEDSKETA